MRWLEENGKVLTNCRTPRGWIITWCPSYHSVATSTAGTDNIGATDALFNEIKNELFRTAIMIECGEI